MCWPGPGWTPSSGCRVNRGGPAGDAARTGRAALRAGPARGRGGVDGRRLRAGHRASGRGRPAHQRGDAERRQPDLQLLPGRLAGRGDRGPQGPDGAERGRVLRAAGLTRGGPAVHQVGPPDPQRGRTRCRPVAGTARGDDRAGRAGLPRRAGGFPARPGARGRAGPAGGEQRAVARPGRRRDGAERGLMRRRGGRTGRRPLARRGSGQRGARVRPGTAGTGRPAGGAAGRHRVHRPGGSAVPDRRSALPRPVRRRAGRARRLRPRALRRRPDVLPVLGRPPAAAARGRPADTHSPGPGPGRQAAARGGWARRGTGARPARPGPAPRPGTRPGRDRRPRRQARRAAGRTGTQPPVRARRQLGADAGGSGRR